MPVPLSLWDVWNVRAIGRFVIVLGVLAGVYFLYTKQLGSAAFLLLSIYFFVLAYRQVAEKQSKENENGNDRYS